MIAIDRHAQHLLAQRSSNFILIGPVPSPPAYVPTPRFDDAPPQFSDDEDDVPLRNPKRLVTEDRKPSIYAPLGINAEGEGERERRRCDFSQVFDRPLITSSLGCSPCAVRRPCWKSEHRW